MQEQQKKRLPPAGLYAVIGIVVVALAVGGWLFVVGPQRSKAALLKKEIAATKLQIADYQSQTLAAKKLPKIRVADLYLLAKAMPNQTAMPDVLLQIDQLASDAGITLNSITPQTALNLPSYQVIPIQLTFMGNFYNLADLLYRLRNLVGVHNGQLDANGRLFAIDEVDFGPPPAPAAFPELAATLKVDAFVYGNTPVAAATGTSGTAAGTGTGTGTSTSPTSSTTTSTSGATASPSSSLPSSGATAAGAHP